MHPALNTNKAARNRFLFAALFFLLFIVLTVEVRILDVRPIGPEGSEVGFSALNGEMANLIGTSELCYLLSEVLGALTLLIPVLFAALGLFEWIRQKSLRKVDRDLFVLCGAYALTAAFYVLFEVLVINYRPVLSDGVLEASYPSSHTLLAVVIFGTALSQVRSRIRNQTLRRTAEAICIFLTVLSVALRFLSGVHWTTDIIAGLLLGAAVVLSYEGGILLVDRGPDASTAE